MILQILSYEELYEEIGQMASRVSDVTDLRASICKVLLNNVRWNTEDLVDRFYNVYSQRIFLRLNQVSEFTSFSVVESKRCEICFCNVVDDHCIGTDSCKHSFCINDHEWLIRCPAGNCVLLTEDHVFYLVTDERLKRLYKKAMSSISLKNCPGIDCGYTWLISRQNTSNLIINCRCGDRFCFDCQSIDHSPATCAMITQWRTFEQDGYACYDWLLKNTKKCPGCKTNIEKNGGCEHMTCKRCKHEFCWLCLAARRSSDHSCNLLVRVAQSVDSTKQTNDCRYKKQLQRHLTALADRDRILALKIRIESMIANGSSNNVETDNSDVLRLQKAIQVLTEAHQMLAFCHIYVFFISSFARFCVKNVIKRLEAAAEDLESILNQHLFDLNNNKHPSSRKRFDGKIDKVQKRSSKLLAYTRPFNSMM
ncbi:RBR-type E3 ubiquitin transferase [Aphelenchoides besseyi]|nr:RBR-type E3 ubiquitin transferase [Aphelenchoides besseyi]